MQPAVFGYNGPLTPTACCKLTVAVGVGPTGGGGAAGGGTGGLAGGVTGGTAGTTTDGGTVVTGGAASSNTQTACQTNKLWLCVTLQGHCRCYTEKGPFACFSLRCLCWPCPPGTLISPCVGATGGGAATAGGLGITAGLGNTGAVTGGITGSGDGEGLLTFNTTGGASAVALSATNGPVILKVAVSLLLSPVWVVMASRTLYTPAHNHTGHGAVNKQDGHRHTHINYTL